MTIKEHKVLTDIKNAQNEQGHSDYLSTDAKTKSIGGIISSLQKKGLIYDSYNQTDEEWKSMNCKPFKMWCLTDDGAKIVGIPSGWDLTTNQINY